MTRRWSGSGRRPASCLASRRCPAGRPRRKADWTGRRPRKTIDGLGARTYPEAGSWARPRRASTRRSRERSRRAHLLLRRQRRRGSRTRTRRPLWNFPGPSRPLSTRPRYPSDRSSSERDRSSLRRCTASSMGTRSRLGSPSERCGRHSTRRPRRSGSSSSPRCRRCLSQRTAGPTDTTPRRADGRRRPRRGSTPGQRRSGCWKRYGSRGVDRDAQRR